MHPDPYYVPKTAESKACHRKKKKKKKNIAGFYGTPYSYVFLFGHIQYFDPHLDPARSVTPLFNSRTLPWISWRRIGRKKSILLSVCGILHCSIFDFILASLGTGDSARYQTVFFSRGSIAHEGRQDTTMTESFLVHLPRFTISTERWLREWTRFSTVKGYPSFQL